VHFENALALHDPIKHSGLANRLGTDVGTTLHGFLALNLMLLGESQRAAIHARKCEQAALASNQANSICYAHTHLALLALLSQDDAQLAHHAAVLSSVATEHELDTWSLAAKHFQALVAAGEGDESSIARIFEADASYIAVKAKLYLPQMRVAAAWRARAMTLREPALKLAAMAQAMIDDTGEAVVLADLHRLEGALALEAGKHERAEACLEKALAVARDQGSKLWELRAANDLARLWGSAGRSDEAAALLSRIVQKIPDDNCAKDRATAQSMLVEFAA
jgi:tetratricopeptide (TPR) repeat protein